MNFQLKISIENYSVVCENSFIKTNGSINSYIGMTSSTFSCREKEYIADMKYNSKTTAFERIYHEEALQIHFKQNNKQNFKKQIREIFFKCSSKIILCTFYVKH